MFEWTKQKRTKACHVICCYAFVIASYQLECSVVESIEVENELILLLARNVELSVAAKAIVFSSLHFASTIFFIFSFCHFLFPVRFMRQTFFSCSSFYDNLMRTIYNTEIMAFSFQLFFSFVLLPYSPSFICWFSAVQTKACGYRLKSTSIDVSTKELKREEMWRKCTMSVCLNFSSFSIEQWKYTLLLL